MSRDRWEFIEALIKEGVPMDVSTRILRLAATFIRLETESCNRPLSKKEQVRSEWAWDRMTALLKPYGVTLAQPNGLVVRLVVPSGRDAGWGGMAVPARRS